MAMGIPQKPQIVNPLRAQYRNRVNNITTTTTTTRQLQPIHNTLESQRSPTAMAAQDIPLPEPVGIL